MIDLEDTQLDDEEVAAFVEHQRKKAARESEEKKKVDQKIRSFRWSGGM